MSALHHPSEETLARYAAGTLGSGLALVVAAHLEACSDCRRNVSLFEDVGGHLLNALAPVELAADALAKTLARIETPVMPHRSADRPRRGIIDLPTGMALPRVLQDCEIRPWRWGGPGVRWSRVGLPYDRFANVLLLRIAAGRKMPQHGHTGMELNLVLKGAYSDLDGHYAPGDLSEADAETEHQPVVDRDGECICLAALEGRIRLDGFFGRLLQPVIGV